MKQAQNITVRRKCTDCGHEQDVTSAAAQREGDTVHYYFGSKHDFCEKCDGPMTDVAGVGASDSEVARHQTPMPPKDEAK